MNQRRKWLRRIGIAASLAAFVTASFFGSWFARNRLFCTPTPHALWTVNDLPKLPNRSDNGWVILHETSLTLPALALSPQLSKLLPLHLSDDRSLAEQLDSSKLELSSFLESERTQKWILAYESALAKPAFSDSCEPKLQSDCRIIPIFKAHQVYELYVLDLAVRANWDSAFSALAKLVRADALFLGTTRGILNHMVGAACAKRSLHLAQALISSFGKLPKTPSSSVISSITRKSLTDSIDGLNPDDISPKRALIAEYLFAVDALSYLSSSPAEGESPSESLLANWLHDPGDSLERLNATYLRLADYAVDPLHQSPPASDVDPISSPFWWWHNPAGKLAFRSSQRDISGQIRKEVEERSEIMKTRDDCKNALRAAFSD